MKSNKTSLTALETNSGFLNENEIREIIRRKILIHESLKNPIYNLILEQGTGVGDIADQLKGEGFDGLNSASMIRNTANTITVLGNVASTTAIMALPLVPVVWKLKAIAAIGAGTALANEFVKNMIEESVLEGTVKEIFQSGAGQYAPAVEFAGVIANGITTGRIKMPQLPPNPAGISDTLGMPTGNVSAAQYSQFLNTYADSLGSPADFLGIPIADFTQSTYPGSNIPSWPAMMSPGVNHKQVAEDAYNAFVADLNAVSATNTAVDSLIAKLSDSKFSALDYVYIDFELGEILEGRGNVTPVWDGATFSVDHFACKKAKYDREKGDSEFSNLYFIAKNADIRSSYDDADVSQLIENKFGSDFLTKISDERMITLNQDIANVPEKLEVYTLGRGLGCVFPENGRNISSGKTYIGKGFFDALELSLLERAEGILNDVMDYLSSAISNLPNTLSALWSAVTSAISSGLSAVGGFFAAVGAFLVSIWNSISGGGGGSGTSRAPASRRQRYRSEVEEMQRLMNKINTDKGLGGPTIGEDGFWGSQTDDAWELVTNYGFASGVLSGDPDANVYDSNFHKWPTMSRDLQDSNGVNYPGYTPNPQGALNIIKDIDSGNTGAGLGVGTGTTRQAATDQTSQTSQGSASTGGTITTSGITIQVDSGNNQFKTLESLGYPAGTTQNVSDAIIRSIQSESFSGTGEGSLNLSVHFSSKGMVLNHSDLGLGGVRRAGTQRRLPIAGNFKNLYKEICDVLRSSGRIPELVDPDNPTVTNVKRNGKQKREYNLSITIPSGVKQRR